MLKPDQSVNYYSVNKQNTPSDNRAHAEEMLASMTTRQVEVMELAASHLPNKEIARALDLSPSTIEQRFQYVKSKLGTADRSSTIREYVRLRAICGQTAYDFSHLDQNPAAGQIHGQDAIEDRPREPVRPEASGHNSLDDLPSRLEVLDGKYGPWWRLAAIFLIALAIATTALVVTAISVTIADIL